MLTRPCHRCLLPITDSYTCCARTLHTPLDSHGPSDMSIPSEPSAQVILTSIPLLFEHRGYTVPPSSFNRADTYRHGTSISP